MNRVGAATDVSYIKLACIQALFRDPLSPVDYVVHQGSLCITSAWTNNLLEQQGWPAHD